VTRKIGGDRRSKWLGPTLGRIDLFFFTPDYPVEQAFTHVRLPWLVGYLR
jgi:hypothetical protein